MLLTTVVLLVTILLKMSAREIERGCKIERQNFSDQRGIRVPNFVIECFSYNFLTLFA